MLKDHALLRRYGHAAVWGLIPGWTDADGKRQYPVVAYVHCSFPSVFSRSLRAPKRKSPFQADHSRILSFCIFLRHQNGGKSRETDPFATCAHEAPRRRDVSSLFASPFQSTQALNGRLTGIAHSSISQFPSRSRVGFHIRLVLPAPSPFERSRKLTLHRGTQSRIPRSLVGDSVRQVPRYRRRARLCRSSVADARKLVRSCLLATPVSSGDVTDHRHDRSKKGAGNLPYSKRSRLTTSAPTNLSRRISFRNCSSRARSTKACSTFDNSSLACTT